MTAAKKPDETPEAPTPVLVFRGGSRFIFGVPKRDLFATDLERLIYRAGRIRATDEAFAAALERRLASLVKSGLYASAGPAPVAPAAPATEPAPEAAPTDAAPAAEE